MPIYEFKCLGCGSDFEELVFNTSEKIECPGCNCGDVERLMSAFAIHGQRSDGSSVAASSCSKSSCSGCGTHGCGSRH